MQENFTVIDTNYQTNLKNGEKKAKMGKDKIASIKKQFSKRLLNQSPTVEENKVETPVVQQPQIEAPAISVSEHEVETNSKIINFPSKEVFEKRFLDTNSTCYENFPGKIIVPNAARRLRTVKKVPELLKYATNVVGFTNEIEIKQEELQQETSKEPSKEVFDFSQLTNQNTLGVLEKEAPAKLTPSIDDYFQKETEFNQVESDLDNTSVELQNARINYENILESYKTQCEIQEQLEKELQELRQQRVIKIEEYRQKTLEETQNLNDVLTKINQLKDAIDEERKALGLGEEEYKKTI